MRAPKLGMWLMCALGLTMTSCLTIDGANDSAEAKAIPNAEYVQVKNGQLTVNGKRQRYWAVIGKPYIPAKIKKGDSAEVQAEKIEKSRKGTDVLMEHFENVGFNSCRLWTVVPNTDDYVKGDGSGADCVDYFIAKCKEKGWKVWVAGLGNRVGFVNAKDVNLVDDPATAKAWLGAIEEYNSPKFKHKGKFKRKDIRHSYARIWDPRIEAAYINAMRRNAQHMNKHTGLRWSDDPVFAVWELSNEEWWMRRMLGGGWTKEPKFFRNQLIAKWNQWLKERYKNDAGLKKAWKKLLPGESLDKGTILLAPMAGKTDPSISMNDSNPNAKQALMGVEQEYSRDDFDRARGGDVLEFLLGLHLSHKQRCADAVKTFGKSCRLSPTIYDTGIGYNIHSQFIHQNADAVAHDAYVNGWGPAYKAPDLANAKTANRKMLMTLDKERISANDGPWVNWLLKPPGISQGVPWLEHNRVEGKPFLVYETQIQQPAKYRADFPLRLAALATIQDWDWISWHYFATDDDIGMREKPFDKPMDVTYGSHPQGYHFTWDEVQQAMMRQASLIWRNENLAPAANPTKFIFGKKYLRDPDSMDYAGSYGTLGFDMLQTVYQYGVRIEIDPNLEDSKVIGPVVKYEDRNKHNPYTPTKAITFDWKKGYLMFDDPETVAFSGLLNKYGKEVKFKNGVVLKDVKINNPKDIFDPVTEDKKYIAFAYTSEDGKPLAETGKASIALMSTSFNKGFSLDPKLILEKGHPSKAKCKKGGLPVLVARVGATIESPALNGMIYTFRDFEMKPIGSGTIKDGKLVIPNNKPIFLTELKR